MLAYRCPVRINLLEAYNKITFREEPRLVSGFKIPADQPGDETHLYLSPWSRSHVVSMSEIVLFPVNNILWHVRVVIKPTQQLKINLRDDLSVLSLP